MKRAVLAAALAMGLAGSRVARAEVSLAKTADDWELYTQGRVDAFFNKVVAPSAD